MFAALVAGGAVTLILTKLFDKEERINDSIKNVQAKRLAKDIIEGKTSVFGIDYVNPEDDMLSFKFSAKKELTEAEKNVIETEKRQKEFEKAVKKQDSQKFWKGVNDKAKSIFKNPSTYIISSAIALEIIQITLDMIVLKPVLVKASDIEAITILKAAYPKFEISDYLRYLETTNDIARIENFKKQNIF